MAAFYCQDKKTIEDHKQENLSHKKIRKALIIFVASMYISNALDEFVFNPYDVKVSEYIGAIIAAVISVAQYNSWYERIKHKVIIPFSTKFKEWFLHTVYIILNSWNK